MSESGSGHAGLPAHLSARMQRPEVQAALEAARAKLAAQQAAAAQAASSLQGGVAAAPGPPYSTAHQQRQSSAAASAPAGATAVARTNPIFGEAAVLSPDKKVDREYTPVLADAIRAPTLEALAPEAGLPPVGDLFSAACPALPAYLDARSGSGRGPMQAAAADAAPQLPDWDRSRPFLTGTFLLDEAAGKGQDGSAGSRAGSRAGAAPAVLDTYPTHVQESLRECCPLGGSRMCRCCCVQAFCLPMGDGRRVLFPTLNLHPPPIVCCSACRVSPHLLPARGAAAPPPLCRNPPCTPTPRCTALRRAPAAAVVDDLLFAFLGLSGTYVRARPVSAPGGARLGYEVAARGQLEPALQEMAARMLPIWWVLASCAWIGWAGLHAAGGG